MRMFEFLLRKSGTFGWLSRSSCPARVTDAKRPEDWAASHGN